MPASAGFFIWNNQAAEVDEKGKKIEKRGNENELHEKITNAIINTDVLFA